MTSDSTAGSAPAQPSAASAPANAKSAEERVAEAKRSLLEYAGETQRPNALRRHPYTVLGACLAAGFLLGRAPAARRVAFTLLKCVDPDALRFLFKIM
jgi:hypothetical protein